jgi:hypothetical protein
MATRTRKQTIPATPFAETVAPETVAPSELKFDWAAFIKGEATWKRWACAVVASLAASTAVGYAGGYLVAYLTVAAILVSSSTFLAMTVYALSVLLVMYAGYRASMFAYIKVIDKTVDAKFAQAKSFVTGLFSSSTVVQGA